MKLEYAIAMAGKDAGVKFGSDRKKTALSLKTLEFCGEWGRMAGRDWNMDQDLAQKECKKFVKERWSQTVKEEKRYGSILGLIFVFVIVKLVADWIVNRFVYHCYQN